MQNIQCLYQNQIRAAKGELKMNRRKVIFQRFIAMLACQIEKKAPTATYETNARVEVFQGLKALRLHLYPKLSNH